MTCIVGTIENKKIVIGGDSAAVDPDSLSLFRSNREKVFKLKNEFNEEALIGFTDSFRMADIIQYNFDLPRIENRDPMRYMVRHFVEYLRETFKEGGYSKISDNREEGGSFIIGICGRLFVLYDDFHVNECSLLFSLISHLI